MRLVNKRERERERERGGGLLFNAIVLVLLLFLFFILLKKKKSVPRPATQTKERTTEWQKESENSDDECWKNDVTTQTLAALLFLASLRDSQFGAVSGQLCTAGVGTQQVLQDGSVRTRL